MTKECFLSQKKSEQFKKRIREKDFGARNKIMNERADRRDKCKAKKVR